MKNIIAGSLWMAISMLGLSSLMAQNTTRNYNDATGFVFGDIKFNMPYSTAKSFLIDAPGDYTEKDRIFLSTGKFGNKFFNMPIGDTIEVGFYNKKLNRLIFKIDPANLNTDNITKEFNKKPDTLTEEWAYWINGNYVLDITVDKATHKKRIQLEYMGF